MRFPRSENLFNSLRKRELGKGLNQQQKSTIIRNLSSNMEARAIISQQEFNSAIKKVKNETGNARLNFPMRDLREITFPPAVDEANETNTKFIRSCFTGVTFPDNANLKGLNFQKADFSHAKLRQANLSNADLSNANLSNADLSGADLSGADLSGTDLSGADLSGANLSITELNGANLSGANLSGANLSMTELNGANLSGANLIKTDLKFAELNEADLSYAKLNEADLSYARLEGANLNRVDFSRANLTGANLTRADLTGANLFNADLKGADLKNADLTRANLFNADLRGADLHMANFKGADLSKTLEASITGVSDDIRAKNVSIILNKLGKTEIIKMLGTDDKVPAINYLEDLIKKPKVQVHKSRIDNIKEVITLLKEIFKTKIQSTTPSPDTEASRGVNGLSDRISRAP